MIVALTLVVMLPLANGASGSERSGEAQTGWSLLWADEFDGEAGAPPDATHWDHEVNCWGGGNNEKQCYTDRAENASLDGAGNLRIVAIEEPYSGPALQDDDPGYPGSTVSRDYTSARLRTKGLEDWTYGRVEVRAKLPGGQGMWPAIWMLPSDSAYGTWPSSGEIDIVEAVNLPTGDFAGWGPVVHGTLHYGLPWPQWENHGTSYEMAENPTEDFHVYAVEWDSDEIRWYVDGVHYQTQTSDGWYNYVWDGQDGGFVVANPRAPFDQPFHLIMNVAVGGDWPGTPDVGWDAPREMLIDYVRVYECGRGTVEGAGKACGSVDDSVAINEDIGRPGINEYLLYADGSPKTLIFDSLATTSTPVPGSFAFPGVTIEERHRPNGWDINMYQTGELLWGAFVGNVFLTAGDLSPAVSDAGRELALRGGSGWTTNGELSFDMKILEIDPATRLFVKMDSVYPKVGSVEIDIPEDEAWHQVSVRIADLMANQGDQPLDITSINNAFVLEATGPVHLRVDDVALSCAYNTEPEDWQIDKTCELMPRVVDSFKNGDFSNGIQHWEPWAGNGGNALFGAEAGSARIDVLAAGSETWSVQFNQRFDLEPGSYSISFRMRSDQPRDANVTMEDEADGYRRDLDQWVALDGEWQDYGPFAFDWLGGAQASLKFLLGAPGPDGHVVFIDDVVIEPQTP